MSVSSHLTPEPERRLWLLLEKMRYAMAWAEGKVGALSFFVLVEFSILKAALPGGWLGFLGLGALAAALPLAIVALSPLVETTRRLPWLEPPLGRPTIDDSLIAEEDIAKYSHGDLILKLDRYLGGGITSTQYYEDIVLQILLSARIAVRKQRLFLALCALAGLGQLSLLARLIGS
jgi:hypothetical protein